MTNSITHYLEAVRRGEPGAAQVLLEKVYDSLRKIAAVRLGREHHSGGFQPTELVHEAWLRLGANEALGWENRLHFFAAAAEAMRRTLIDDARRRLAGKRGGPEAKRQALRENDLVSLPLADELLDLDEALADLEKVYGAHAQIVKLKFFAGLTTAEIASVSNVSVATIERHWAFARTWLHRRMQQ